MMNTSSTNKLTIHGLIKAVTDLQQEMDQRIIEDPSWKHQNPNKTPKDLSIRKHLSSIVQTTEEVFHNTGKTAANLSIRSRRAYQWLKYLTTKANFSLHLDTLSETYALVREINPLKKIPQGHVFLRFYHITPLYTVKQKHRSITLTIHETFIHAPTDIRNKLLKTVFSKENRKDKAILTRYISSPEFTTIREHLEYLAIPRDSYARGRAWDLRQLFNRVNDQFFNSSIPSPHLTWSDRITYRKFGHYQFDTDTIMISTSLDHPKVPKYVLEYVMFHEILHKKIGYRRSRNRRYIHTADFRAEELKFPKLEPAKAYLQALSQSLAR